MKGPRSSCVLALATALVAGPGWASAEGLKKLTVERLHAEPPLAGPLPTDLAWHPDGKRLTYLRKREAKTDLCALDLVSGRESVLLAGSPLLATPAGGSASRAPFYSWSPDGEALLVARQGDLYLVDARTGAVRLLTRTPEADEFPEFSPDGRRIAFLRSGDLFVIEVASGRETRLTRSGSDTVLNGRLDWVYEEELANRSGKAYSWAPDSRAVAYLQLDQARVPTFPIVDFIPVPNDVQTQRYPTPGTPNAVVRVGVVGLDREGRPGPERLLSFAPDDMYVVPEMAWTPDSRGLAFERLNREQSELQLRLLPVPDSPAEPLGAARTVLAEKSPTWVDVLGAPRFLKDGRRFLWLSERDGFTHLYLCEASGACRPMTQGPWVVDKLLAMDERTGFAYYTSTEKDPRERQLYRVRLDGTGRARLSREDGTHEVTLSPDTRYEADTWSDAVTPPRLAVLTTDGSRRVPLEENRSPAILQYERGSVEWVDVKASDGTVLHATLLKPPDFDPSRRYPVVLSVYGGPHAQTVLDKWGSTSSFEHLLAGHGFLVWALDNRGSAGRGQAFESPLYRDMGKVELADHLAGVAYLESLPYVDPARIGIFGWSYGGYLTLYALTHAPGVFRAGVAGAPVADWRFYDTIYTERYMGTPASNPQGYETSSPLRRAADLEAALLIIHGTADDNVHLANSIAFADALIKAGKPHALLLHPRQKHGFREREDQVARDAAILRHFETYLK